VKIEVGKSYKDAYGAKVTIVHKLNKPNDYPDAKFIGVRVFPGGFETTLKYSENGRCYSSVYCDLVAEWKDPIEVRGFVNVFKDGSRGTLHKTRESADNPAHSYARIACVEVYGKEEVN
jgi:hypothetical protein